MRKIAAVIVACIVCCGLCAVAVRAEEPRAEAGKQIATQLDAQVHVTLKYLLYLPADYDKQEKWPLILFLHGAGERGDNVERVKVHGPPKLVDHGKQLPFILVSPQCPTGHWWNNELTALSALLDDICSKYKVDKDRIYLTGLSMGGFGTWALAAYSPDRFAAIVPICGGGEPLVTRALRNMPVWAFHGAKDPVVPVKRSQDLIDALKRTNREAKLTIYPDALHDSWTATYDNPEVFEWLLMHKRQRKQ